MIHHNMLFGSVVKHEYNKIYQSLGRTTQILVLTSDTFNLILGFF